MEPRTFVPRDIPMRFDADAMPDIDRWVHRHGRRMLFVNGTQDAAVAEAFRPNNHDSHMLWARGAGHSVTLADLSPTDRAQAVSLLTRWTSKG